MKPTESGSESGERREDALETVADGISGKWPWNARQDRCNQLEIVCRIGFEIGRWIVKK